MSVYDAIPVIGSNSDLGEGTLWDDRIQKFLWVDVYKNLIKSYDPISNLISHHQMPWNVSYIGKRTGSGFVVASVRHIYLLNEKFEVEEEIDLNLDAKIERTNDGNVDHFGRLWIGTADVIEGNAKANLFHLDNNLIASVAKQNVAISNGIDWSPNLKIMYYIDSPIKSIEKYEFDSTTNKLGASLEPISLTNTPGVPDGMCTDNEGNLWVAIWGAGQVRNYSPVGELLNTIQCPTALITCCSFGGPNLQTLFITSAKTTFDPQFNFGSEMGGDCFRVDLPVSGKLDNELKR